MDELDHVKGRLRAAWGAGDFTSLARMLAPTGAHLLDRLAVGPGNRVLDVGCGTGELAVEAAGLGATVTGVDLAPEMIARAEALGVASDVSVTWQEGDAEDLPVGDGSMDAVMSSFGCMLAPRHRVAAAELVRVLRPGGRLGVLTWPVGSVMGEFLSTAGAHIPPPPAIAESPLLWGDPEHIAEIFAGTGVELAIETGTVSFPFASPADALELYTTRFGPLVTARAALEPKGRWQALSDDVAAFFERRMTPEGDHMVLSSGYMLIVGRAAG